MQRAVIAGFSEETAALFMRNVPRAADTFCAPPSPGASAALNFRGAADVGRVALPALVLSHAAVFTISEAIEVVRYHNHKRLRQRRRIRIAHSVDSDKSLAQAIRMRVSVRVCASVCGPRCGIDHPHVFVRVCASVCCPRCGIDHSHHPPGNSFHALVWYRAAKRSRVQQPRSQDTQVGSHFRRLWYARS